MKYHLDYPKAVVCTNCNHIEITTYCLPSKQRCNKCNSLAFGLRRVIDLPTACRLGCKPSREIPDYIIPDIQKFYLEN